MKRLGQFTRTIMRETSERALDWLATQTDYFLPPERSPPSEASLTALTELSLFLGLVANTDVAHRASVKCLVERACAAFANPTVLEFYENAPPQAAIGCMVTWLGLSRHCPQGIWPIARMQRYARDKRVGSFVASVMRLMEVRWALARLTPSQAETGMDELWQILREHELEPAQPVSAQRCYVLTHTIFYATDFGSAKITGHRASETREDVIRSMTWAIDREHWDLVGELLVAWGCLSNRSDEAIERGSCALRDAQMPDGTFPVGAAREIVLENRPERVLALRRYHVCLTAAMAGTLPVSEPGDVRSPWGVPTGPVQSTRRAT